MSFLNLQRKSRKFGTGITMAELLIAMLILAQIAAFTIPKVLVTQQNQRYNAMGKEAVATVAESYQLYVLKNGRSTSFAGTALLPYLNYTRLKTSGDVDDVQTYSNMTCSSTQPCVVFHNGGCMRLNNNTFSGSSNLHVTSPGTFDPDCQYSGTTMGNSKSLDIWVYYNGRVSTYKNVVPGTIDPWGGVWSDVSTAAIYDPPWFSF